MAEQLTFLARLFLGGQRYGRKMEMNRLKRKLHGAVSHIRQEKIKQSNNSRSTTVVFHSPAATHIAALT